MGGNGWRQVRSKDCGRFLCLHGERGQSVVELALILPVLLLITLAAADFARLFIADVSVANAAREAARYGSLHYGDTAGIQNQAYVELGSATVVVDPSRVSSVDVSRSAAPSPPGGNQIAVTVRYRFDLVTPIPLGQRGLTLTSTAVMRAF